MYDMSVAVRPTDGKAFIVGTTTGKVWFGRLGGAPVQDIHGASGNNASQWPTLAFGNDGTGYVAWRGGDQWNMWLVTVPPTWDGGALPSPINISAAMSASAGARNATQADFGVSRKTGLLYAAAYFEYGSYATTGVVQSSDGGRTWGNYKELARDNTRSNQSPRIHVSPYSDNVHVITRNNTALIAISRINGVWDATPQILMDNSEPGWDIRSQDGKIVKAISEAKSGTAVSAWKHPGTSSVAVAIRKPGQGWQIFTKSLKGNYKPQTVSLSGTPGGDMCMFVQYENPPFGAHLYVLPPLNDSFGPENIIPIKTESSWGMNGCAVDASAYGGRVWLAWTVKGDLPEKAYYSSAAYDGSIPAAPPVTSPPPVVVTPTPPPVVTPPLTPVNEFLPPSSVGVEAKSFNQVLIYWKDKTSDEVEFSVERKEKDIPYRIVGSAAANATQWLDVIGIEPDTKYTYRVRAHKTGLYSNYSMEVSTVTPSKPAPVPVPQPQPQPQPQPVPVDPNIKVVNGFQLGHGMLDYWNKFVMSGVPHPLGLPKSNEMDYIDPVSKKKYVIQAFERAVLGYDAAEPNERYKVQPLLIGAEWLKAHVK